MTFGRVALLSLALTSGGALTARAADMPSPTAPIGAGTSDTYIITLTGTAAATPTFPGSDKFTAIGFPSLRFRRSDEPARFAAPDDGISFSVFDNPTFRAGPLFRYQPGRYLEDDRRLFGLRKRNWDIEGGGFLEYWPLDFIRLRAELRHGFRGDSGFAATLGADFVAPVDRWTFSIGPRLDFGNSNYMRRYFGVTPAEALLNGRVTPFRPGSGIEGVGGLAAVTYTWNEQWATTGYVKYSRLVSDAGDSPIVRRIGSPNQFTLGARVSYSFAFTPNW